VRFDDTSILRAALRSLLRSFRLATVSRLSPPRSGLERSDFVPWREAAVRRNATIWSLLEVKLTLVQGQGV
jgi:hypothetical protein